MHADPLELGTVIERGRIVFYTFLDMCIGKLGNSIKINKITNTFVI